MEDSRKWNAGTADSRESLPTTPPSIQAQQAQSHVRNHTAEQSREAEHHAPQNTVGPIVPASQSESRAAQSSAAIQAESEAQTRVAQSEVVSYHNCEHACVSYAEAMKNESAAYTSASSSVLEALRSIASSIEDVQLSEIINIHDVWSQTSKTTNDEFTRLYANMKNVLDEHEHAVDVEKKTQSELMTKMHELQTKENELQASFEAKELELQNKENKLQASFEAKELELRNKEAELRASIEAKENDFRTSLEAKENDFRTSLEAKESELQAKEHELHAQVSQNKHQQKETQTSQEKLHLTNVELKAKLDQSKEFVERFMASLATPRALEDPFTGPSMSRRPTSTAEHVRQQEESSSSEEQQPRQYGFKDVAEFKASMKKPRGDVTVATPAVSPTIRGPDTGERYEKFKRPHPPSGSSEGRTKARSDAEATKTLPPHASKKRESGRFQGSPAVAYSGSPTRIPLQPSQRTLQAPSVEPTWSGDVYTLNVQSSPESNIDPQLEQQNTGGQTEPVVPSTPVPSTPIIRAPIDISSNRKLEILEHIRWGDPGKLTREDTHHPRELNCPEIFHLIFVVFGHLTDTAWNRGNHKGMATCLYCKEVVARNVTTKVLENGVACPTCTKARKPCLQKLKGSDFWLLSCLHHKWRKKGSTVTDLAYWLRQPSQEPET